MAAVEAVASTAFGGQVSEENKPECQLKPADTKGFICELRVPMHLETGACIVMGIRIWNGIGVMLLDGVHKCAMAGSCNTSQDDTGGEDGWIECVSE